MALSEMAARAILRRWGETERYEQIGYPQQCFYLSAHNAGYRETHVIGWDTDQVERTLTAVKRNEPMAYRRLRRAFVEQQRVGGLDKDIDLFCEYWDDDYEQTTTTAHR